MQKRLSYLALLFAALLMSRAALADTVSFTLGDPSQSGAPGSVFTYDGTISAPDTNAGDVYLNGDTINQTGDLSVDDSPFFNAPLFLAPGQSYTGELFTVTTEADSAIGTTTGSFVLLGGPTDLDTNTLATANFSTQVTPEPSSLWLLATGGAGMWGMVQRRRRASQLV